MASSGGTRVAMGGYWVFGSGGLFHGKAVETPPLFHIVNIEGQNDALEGGTLCGWARFKDGCAGGSWRPEAAPYAEKGSAEVGAGSDNPQVCPRCADRAIWLIAHGLDWDAFKRAFNGRRAAA